MLAEKMKSHKADAWLINTGWNGGVYGTGKRISLKFSRAIIDAIHSGELKNAQYEIYPKFNLSIPKAVTGVPSDILDPTKTWLGTQESFFATRDKLSELFKQNFKSFADKAGDNILAAGPE
jgi:ATP-dependent phosphoenolpyruvate carboxykinase